MGEIFDFDIFACTITGSASGEGRSYSPSGGFGDGYVVLTIEPCGGPDSFLLDWAVDEKSIPSEYRASVIEGIQRVAAQSVAAQGDPNPRGEDGPLVGIKITVTGGKFHPKQSTPAGYKAAAALAFQEALAKTTVVSVAPSEQRRITRFDMLACTITHGTSGEGKIYMPDQRERCMGPCHFDH